MTTNGTHRIGRGVRVALAAAAVVSTATTASKANDLKALRPAVAKVQIPFVPKATTSAYATGQVLVKLRPARVNAASAGTATLPHVAALNGLAPARIAASANAPEAEWFLADLDGTAAVEQVISELATHPDVLRVEPNYLMSTNPPVAAGPVVQQSTNAAGLNDPQVGLQYALDRIEAPAAWDIEPGDRSIVVAVVDGGMTLDHPDLIDHLWRNSRETVNNIDDDGNGLVDDVFGYDFINKDSNPSDDNGHGSHVAGIVAAVRNNAKGVAGTADVSLMAVKVLEQGTGDMGSIMAGVEYAVANGARVVNLSLGGGGYSAAFDDICKRAAARGVVIVAATGNSGLNTIDYPSAYADVIAVGATDSGDNLADFSNAGEGIDMVAPGVDIYSTWINGGYAYDSGTSMATPYVAGVAALLLSYDPSLTSAEVRQRLIASADDLGTAGYDTLHGHGRLNAYRALSGNDAPVPPTPETPAGGNDDAYEVNNTSTTAAPIGAGQYQLVGRDEDWYLVTTSTGSITVWIEGQQGDLDLYVFNANGDQLAVSSDYGSNEYVSIQSQPGEYLVAVAPYEGQGGNYLMNIEAPGAAQPAPPQTTPVDEPTYDEPVSEPVTVSCGGGTVPAMAVGLVGFLGLTAGRRRW